MPRGVKAPEWLNAEIQACYPTCEGNIRKIQAAIKETRGVEIAYMTITDRMKRLGLARPRDQKHRQEIAMPEDPVEVLPGQLSIDDADTVVAEVHYGAVHEFDRLPDGYAKEIQPMRPYTEAEEWALNESMRLYGFQGAIVRDQYGRILDGNQRQRMARLRGLSVPHTITHVRDDAHAMEIARALNAVRRHYTIEQRQELAPILREQGFSYREIAVALGVSKDTVQRDILGRFKIVPAPEPDAEIVSNKTMPREHGKIVSNETPAPSLTELPAEIVSHETILTTEPPTPVKSPELPQRVRRKGGGTYPAQRPTAIGKGQAEQTRERMAARDGPHSSWIYVLSHANRLCSSLRRLPDLNDVLESWGPEGREKAVSYLRPLYGNIQQLLWSLKAIDVEPLAQQDPSATTPGP